MWRALRRFCGAATKARGAISQRVGAADGRGCVVAGPGCQPAAGRARQAERVRYVPAGGGNRRFPGAAERADPAGIPDRRPEGTASVASSAATAWTSSPLEGPGQADLDSVGDPRLRPRHGRRAGAVTVRAQMHTLTPLLTRAPTHSNGRAHERRPSLSPELSGGGRLRARGSPLRQHGPSARCPTRSQQAAQLEEAPSCNEICCRPRGLLWTWRSCSVPRRSVDRRSFEAKARR